jgi:hypothetical protein
MRPVLERLCLASLAVSLMPVALWASWAPRNWFETFPGAGHVWNPPLGPFNEHLVRDVGTLSASLLTVVVAALICPERLLVRIAALAVLVNGLPHFVFHSFHLGCYPLLDQIGNVIGLGIQVALSLLLLIFPSPTSR